MGSGEGSFLFKIGAIAVEAHGENLVEKDKIMMQERGDDSFWGSDETRGLIGTRSSSL